MKKIIKISKKQFRIILICLILFILIIGSSSPIIAIRYSLFFRGHLIQAFTVNTEYLDITDRYTFLDENEKMYSLIEPPISSETMSELRNWKIEKYGVFYIATYYGYG